jgi:hypothetical protein
MIFQKAFEAFAAFLETLSVAMTAANSINPVVNFFRCTCPIPTTAPSITYARLGVQELTTAMLGRNGT